MTPESQPTDDPLALAAAGTSVLAVMRAASLRIGLLSVATVGVVLTLGTGLLLHVSTQRQLDLQARSLAYAAEAAVVFQDGSATRQLLHELVQREAVTAASISLPHAADPAGQAGTASPAPAHFAFARRPGAPRPWDAALAGLWPVTSQAPVVAQGEVVGTVHLQADTSMLLQLLAWASAGVLLAMGVAGAAVLRVSQQVALRLVHPVHALAQHTRHVRLHRHPRRPAPRSGVRELDALSADFDALLDDLAAHETRVLQQHGELAAAHQRLAARVQQDSLTGVASRTHFEEHLAQNLERAARERSRLALYFVDADGFKGINDRHGHEAGDRVLAAIAERLRSRVRDDDLIGRLGGDEFVVLVRGQRQGVPARDLAQQLGHAVAQPVQLPGGGTVVPRVSIGTACYPEDGLDATSLLSAADHDMYRHKRARADQARRPAAGEETP